jgi:hypothetical protein
MIRDRFCIEIMPVYDDAELSPEARALLTTLQSRGGTIKGDITKDKVMWLYWSAHPGEILDVAACKELHKRHLIEPRGEVNGAPTYRLVTDHSGRR